jgi:hypothetical protein
MKLGRKEIEFFDGETIDNKYILLGNSENHIVNNKGLSLEQSLDFLFDNGKSVNYFFRISYDLNMFFAKEKITDKVIDFFNSIEVNFYGYDLLYFTDKILIIKKEGKQKKFFDISNFFNTSFIKTLDILKIPLSKQENDFLTKYKNLRSGFEFSDLKNIVKYNTLECVLGLRIAESIYELLPAELQTTSLYGASSITNKFLNNKEIHKKNNFFNLFSGEKFLLTYFGGRMEALKIGTFKKVYKYDINSAYPDIIKDLREIEGFTEKKYKQQKIVEENIYFVKMKIKDRRLIGLLPYRLKSGYIVFPDEVTGWYYGAEIKQVLEYSKLYNIELKIIKFLDIHLGEKIFQNKEIENLFFKRNIFKKKNDLRNYVYKILLNSIYGKFAQRVGSAKFQNIYFAGLITSKTRAKLLEVVKQNPYNVIFFATDGILTKDRLTGIKVNNDLGNWEEIEIKEAKVLLSGVYKCTDFNNKTYLGERGFNFDFEKVFSEILKNRKTKIKQNIFIGIKYYHKNKKGFNNYKCKFKEITKEINPETQIKRLYIDKINLKKENNSFIFNSENIKELNNKLLENHFSEEMDIYSNE